MAPAPSFVVGSGSRLTAKSAPCGILRGRPWRGNAVGDRAIGGGNGIRDWSHCWRVSGLPRGKKEQGIWLQALQKKRTELRKRGSWGFGAYTGQQLRCLSTLPPKQSEPQLEKKPLHENIYTLPNALTVTRLFCAPAVGYLLLHSSYTWALGLFVYAGVTDLVDGWMARRWNMQTVVGTILDPMADKALMTVVVGVLGYQALLPLPLAILILGRDVLLSLTAFYYRWVSLPAPRTLARYWDFSLPSAEVKPTNVSKVNTFLQLGLIGATMGGLAFPGMMGETAQSAMEAMWWVVGGTTVWSGASYLGRGGVKILGKKG